MSGERSSSVRMRLVGKICASCRMPLPEPYPGAERVCEKCLLARQPRHRIYMHFMCRQGWYCQFLESDLKTSLPKKLNLTDPGKIVEMAEKGGVKLDLEGRQSLEQAISTGRGGIWLDLTEDQYRKLKGKR